MFVEDTPYTLAMRSVDSAGNTSPVSNIKNIFLPSATNSPTSPEPTSTSSVPPSSGCSYLVFSTGQDYPDGWLSCHDNSGKKIERTSEDMIVDPETTCIFLSSGHIGDGFEMEFFCNSQENYHFWTVSVRDLQ